MSKFKPGAVLLALLAAGVLVLSTTAVSVGQPAAPLGLERVSGPQFACDDEDADDKGWVLPVYVHFPGDDRYEAEVGSVRRVLWQTDQTFDLSAHRFGVSRRLRIVQDDHCLPIVAKIAFEKGRNRSEMRQALTDSAAGQPQRVRDLLATNRVKTVFFARSDEITDQCTGGGADAGLSGGNVILSRWCWGEAGLTHEMIHTFGLSHCEQSEAGPNGHDPVCRGMGTKPECTSDAASEYHLDSCRTDEFRYFEPTAASQPKPEPLPKDRNVAFSPYLISDQPSPALDFRLKSVPATAGLCVDGAGAEVALRRCSDGKSQVWRRTMDGAGYLTVRNLGTDQCLTMSTTPEQETAAVETAPCKADEPSQQWLPDEGVENSNLVNRTGGMKHAALRVATQAVDGAALTRGSGKFEVEWIGGTAAPAPATRATPSTPADTSAATTTRTSATTTTATTTTAAPAPQAGAGEDQLASTGFGRGWLVVLGAVLLLGGTGLVVAMRRRGARH